MRLIAIATTRGLQQVAYRWPVSLFEAPRLLISQPSEAPADLRRRLERDHFGASLLPDDFHILLPDDDPTNRASLEALQAAFADLPLTVIDPADSRLALLETLLAPSMATDDAALRSLLALTYWGADQLDLADLFDHFARGFLHWERFTVDPERFRRDLVTLRGTAGLRVIGRSAQALQAAIEALIGTALPIPLIPKERQIAALTYRGLPLTITDDRLPPDSPEAIPALSVIVVGSDPGLGAADMALIETLHPDRLPGQAQTLVCVVNTHTDSADYAAMFAYIGSALAGRASVIDVAQLEAAVTAVLGRFVADGLLGWLAAYFPADRLDSAAVPSALSDSIRQAWQIGGWLNGTSTNWPDS